MIFKFLYWGVGQMTDDGGAIGPVVCGWTMDAGRPDWVFLLIAAVTALAVFTVFIGRPGNLGRDGR